MRLPGYIFLAFGVVFLSIGLGLAFWEWAFLRTAQTTAGTVVRLEERTRGEGRGRVHNYAPVFEFEVDGKRHEIVSKVASNPASAAVGDRVEVLYDPANPERAQIKSFLTQWFLPLIFTVLGIVPTVVGTVLLKR